VATALIRLMLLNVQVKFVQEAVVQGRKQHACKGQE
jgi:hypothetical protein